MHKKKSILAGVSNKTLQVLLPTKLGLSFKINRKDVLCGQEQMPEHFTKVIAIEKLHYIFICYFFNYIFILFSVVKYVSITSQNYWFHENLCACDSILCKHTSSTAVQYQCIPNLCFPQLYIKLFFNIKLSVSQFKP